MPKPIGYHRNRRLKRLETKQKAANANDYANTERENECQICYDKLTNKTRQELDCGHNSYCKKCIRQWAGESGMEATFIGTSTQNTI